MKTKKIFSLLFSSICIVLFMGLMPVQAQTQSEGCDTSGDILGIGCADASGLTREDPRVVTIRIVNFALSLLGILSVLIILYAGFTWMTAGGNDEKVESAKKILFAAVSGLVIIMVSYSIMSFVLRSLCAATGSCGGTTGILN